MLFLTIALKEMILDLTPVTHLSVYISYLQPFLNIFWLLLKDTLEKVKSLVCLPSYEKNVSKIIETPDIIWVLLKNFLIDRLRSKILLHSVQTNSHVFKNIKVSSVTEVIGSLKVSQRLRILSISKVSLS